MANDCQENTHNWNKEGTYWLCFGGLTFWLQNNLVAAHRVQVDQILFYLPQTWLKFIHYSKWNYRNHQFVIGAQTPHALVLLFLLNLFTLSLSFFSSFFSSTKRKKKKIPNQWQCLRHERWTMKQLSVLE